MNDDLARGRAWDIEFQLDLLRSAADDERVTKILTDIASGILRSEAVCAEFSQDDDLTSVFMVGEEEEYIEEFLGISFVLLQSHIRRIAIMATYCKFSPEFADQAAVRRWGKLNKNTPHTVAELVWEMANYFKHRDEWMWAEDDDKTSIHPEIQSNPRNKSSDRTWNIVKSLGLSAVSHKGNIRKACEFLEISPSSRCADLAMLVGEWASGICAKAKAMADAALPEPERIRLLTGDGFPGPPIPLQITPLDK